MFVYVFTLDLRYHFIRLHVLMYHHVTCVEDVFIDVNPMLCARDFLLEG